MGVARDVNTKFRLGGWMLTGGGGRGQIQASQSHLSPNSDFSSDFAHFILEILKNLKISVYIQNFSLKIVISGGTFPRNSEPGGRVPTKGGRGDRAGDASPPLRFKILGTSTINRDS